METKLIDLTMTQLARLCLLVKGARAIELNDRHRSWGVLIEGRGFRRMLQEELLVGPGVIRMKGWNTPRPKTFGSKAIAENYMRYVGLRPVSQFMTGAGSSDRRVD